MTIQASPDPAALTPSRNGIKVDLNRDVAEIGVRLLDDAYMAWLLAESEAQEALRAWIEPGPRGRAAAYRAYLAAVDREDAAAGDLRRLQEITAPCLELLARRRLRFNE
jgi:hypothetical protein